MFARYLIKCLPLPCNLPSGSSAQTLRRACQRESLTGGTGGTVHQKVPLIFFILRYIKHYTYMYLNI